MVSDWLTGTEGRLLEGVPSAYFDRRVHKFSLSLSIETSWPTEGDFRASYSNQLYKLEGDRLAGGEFVSTFGKNVLLPENAKNQGYRCAVGCRPGEW